MPSLKPTSYDAYKLLHDGSLVFSQIEHNGIRIDKEYLDKAIKTTDDKIAEIEAKLKSSKLFKVWTKHFGDKTNLGSRPQLGDILFKVLKYPCKKATAKGKPSTDKESLKTIKHPFVRDYEAIEDLRKTRNTFLEGIRREIVDGFLHPSFHLHTVVTLRSSSSEINFQNLPARNKAMAAMVRKCFIPREGRQLLEMDFSGIEVRIACCYTKDPRLISDFTQPGKDPHRDTAAQLFDLPIEYLAANADWAKGTVRDWAKNRFVFPEFYGSVAFQCAPHIWEAITSKDDGGYKYKLPCGKSIRKHLKEKGIKRLGEIDPDEIKKQGGTKKGTYVHHVKMVEDDFWQSRFKVYTEWKRKWWEKYLATGGMHTYTGFTINGLFKRNEVLNFPIQGSAFHCLLWTLIQLQKWLKKHKMKSLIVGQIHDSMVIDAVPSEVDAIIAKVKHIVSVELPKHWKWIIVPMEIEVELCPIGESWYSKKKAA